MHHYKTFDEKRGSREQRTNHEADIGKVAQRHVVQRKSAALVIAICLSLAIFQGWSFLPPFRNESVIGATLRLLQEEKDDRPFEWHEVKPTTELTYHPCHDGFQCARLLVPMDWYNSELGKNVAIAVIRLPAKVPVTDPRYGGAVLTNPGGPGGSGVAQVLRNGRATQRIIDAEMDPNSTSLDSEGLFHDIIGFDPRGIAHTTPSIQCFPDAQARISWTMQNEALGLLGSSEDSFHRNWYRSRALAEGCSAHTGTEQDGSEGIGAHVNTSPVARDMLEITERHAEWLEKEGKRAQIEHDMRHGLDKAQTIANRLLYVKGETKLKYWGNSYGTIIGQTFASMFPTRVSRMILDGVCNAHDYYFGGWFSNLSDADHILEKFFEYCSDAGPDKCSFYIAGGPQAIREVYEDLLQDIFDNPRVVPASHKRGPDVITWSDVKSMVRLGMYQPMIFSTMVSDLLTDVRTGNGSLFADFKSMDHELPCLTPECKSAGAFSPECNDGDNYGDATLAILCTDGPGLGSIDESAFQEYWHHLQQQSSVLGDWWAHTRLGCIGWKTLAKNRFIGPFAGNLSHPILFIGNILDPVTPLANAKEMAENFPGSVVLQQNSEGHCSWAAPSLCTAKTARHYFQTGELPKKGSTCEADAKPFFGQMPRAQELSVQDRELAEAVNVVGETYMDLGFRRNGPLGF